MRLKASQEEDLQDIQTSQYRVSTLERPDKLDRQRLRADLAGSSATLLPPHSSGHYDMVQSLHIPLQST